MGEAWAIMQVSLRLGYHSMGHAAAVSLQLEAIGFKAASRWGGLRLREPSPFPHNQTLLVNSFGLVPAAAQDV